MTGRRKPTSKDKKKDDTNNNSKKKDKKKGKVKQGTEDKEGEEEVAAGPAPGWYLVCQTEADWTGLVDKLRRSKKKADKELHSVLDENFLPDVVKMFADQG